MDTDPVVQDLPDDPNAVGLDTSPAPDDQSVGLPVPGFPDQPPTPEVAAARTTKTSMGLGDVLRKNEKDMYDQYISGNENQLRKEAATAVDFNKAMAKQKTLENIASKNNGSISQEDFLKVVDPFNPNNKPADPTDVIERAYSTNYVSSLNTAKGYMDDNFLNTARASIGSSVDGTLDQGSELLTKNQYILKRAQDTQQNLVGEQSLFGYLVDQAKGITQLYPEYKERGLIEGSSKLAGLGLGSNIDEQSSYLYKLPMDEFKSKFDAAMTYLEQNNPSMAVDYAQKLLGQSSLEAAAGNLFSALAIPDMVAGGKVALAVGQKIGMLNKVRKATKDIVTSATNDPAAGPVRALEGSGDVSEAAVAKVAQNNTEALSGAGSPTDRAEKMLLSTWQDDAKRFADNPGTYLSREAVTRIQDSFVRDGADLFNRLGTMNRVERTPEALMNPDVIRSQKDRIRNDYTGPQNTLLDIDGPIREPESNTNWFRSKIGNYDATLFPDEETARGFADQIGIAEPLIKGSVPERVFIPEAVAKNLESIKTTPGGTRFYMDHGIEVIPSTEPQPGSVPYNLKSGKFEPALTGEAAVKQQGLGFYIEHWSPFKETDDITRDMMIRTSGGSIIKDAVSTNTSSGMNQIKNSVLGWVRNSDETLSVNESAQRKAVTYTQANIQKWAQGLSKDLEDIAAGRVREDPITGEPLSKLVVYPKSWFGKISNREVHQQFERTLDYARKAFDPETGKVGYFFKSPQELQDFYQRSFKRDPSYLETKSYFNFTKLIEGDRMMSEISEFRNRARLGTEQHSVSTIDASTGERVKSPFFDGMKESQWPGSDEQVLIMGRNKGEETLHNANAMDSERVKTLNEKIKTGEGKLIRVYDRDHEPLGNFSEVANGKLIGYVYTEASEVKPITFNHVERRGGGHFEWDYDFYLKQADVRAQTSGGINDKRTGVEHLYVGDKTVMPIKTRALGNNIAKLWNEAHELIKQDRWSEVKPIVQKLGIKYDEFTGWYKPGRDADGNVVHPMLNVNEPITVVNRNKKIVDMGSALQDRYRYTRPDGNTGTTFKDATKTGPANNFKVAYNQERNSTQDVRTINDIGSKNNPIYAHEPADMIDPLTTMNRALNRVINSTFMDDYKISGVERWLREAEPFLNADIRQIRASPFAWFNNPEWRSGIDKTKIWNFMSNRAKIQQLVGIPSKFDTFLHSMTNELADKFYTSFGPEEGRGLITKAGTVYPLAMLHRIKDPVGWMRSIAFNAKLGLFAIPQMLVQAQTHSLIWALEPRHGTVGTYGMLLHNWAKFTTDADVLKSIDNAASKLNMFGSKFRPGEFLEAREALERSGFEGVGGEYSNLDNQLKYKFIKNDFDKLLHMGQAPFRMGEASVRQTAWYTAFREFREANPTAKIGNTELSQILNKADLLNVNMSRASNSQLSNGIFSLPTQFLSYQIKLAELFIGKRTADTMLGRNLARARMLTMFTALYGLPNALGVTGAPISGWVREQFMDDLGYIPGEKWLSTMINEGIPSWTMAMITGKVDNVGDRFGSQGFEPIKQVLYGDATMRSLIFGASGSVIGKSVQDIWHPSIEYMNSWARGDKDPYKITSHDLVQPLKQISSVSAGAKWWTAIQTGKWVNNNDQGVTDVSPLHATLLALTGMSPQDQDDLFTQNQMVKGETEAKKAALKLMIPDIRRGIEAKANNDTEQGNAYFRNAMATATSAGMSPEEKNQAMNIASRGYESMIHQSDMKLWQDGDYNKRDQRLEQYKRKLRMYDEGKR